MMHPQGSITLYITAISEPRSAPEWRKPSAAHGSNPNSVKQATYANLGAAKRQQHAPSRRPLSSFQKAVNHNRNQKASMENIICLQPHKSPCPRTSRKPDPPNDLQAANLTPTTRSQKTNPAALTQRGLALEPAAAELPHATQLTIARTLAYATKPHCAVRPAHAGRSPGATTHAKAATPPPLRQPTALALSTNDSARESAVTTLRRLT
jgi:hypothetical protein